MSSADPTLAERARRHRARKAEEDASVAASIARMAGLLERLTMAVEALRNGGGPAVDNPAPERGRRPQSVAQRDARRQHDAHARTEGAPPPPTGAAGATLEEDAARVVAILTRPGSTAAIADAVDLPRTRTAAALVYLHGHGIVRREEGAGLVPDRWRRVEGAGLDVLADHPAIPLRVDPSPGLTITCEDYAGHAVLAHRWDPGLGRFRCFTCEPPTPMATEPAHRPPAPGSVASPNPGGP